MHQIVQSQVTVKYLFTSTFCALYSLADRTAYSSGIRCYIVVVVVNNIIINIRPLENTIDA